MSGAVKKVVPAELPIKLAELVFVPLLLIVHFVNGANSGFGTDLAEADLDAILPLAEAMFREPALVLL